MVFSRVSRVIVHLRLDPWSQLGGDLFKRGRIGCVYNWEESRLAAGNCPYIEISISHMILFMFTYHYDDYVKRLLNSIIYMLDYCM